jgi:uncharacterized protein
MLVFKTREAILRWSVFIIGLMVLALGVTLTIKAKTLGIGPWDVFHYGLFKQLGLTIGSWAIIVGLLILLTTSLLTKSLPKLGTFLNMVLIGLFIDLFNFLLPAPVHIVTQVIVFAIGTVVLGYGIALYIAADVGAGPRDTLMLAIVKKTGFNVSWVRGGMEVLVLILGWLLGGPVGIGTVIIAVSLGPIVDVGLKQSNRLVHFLIYRGGIYENIN